MAIVKEFLHDDYTERKRMDYQLERWEKLLKQIEIHFEGTDEFTTVTASDLEQFESEMQIKLPAGYKEFCQVFGNGCFDLRTYNQVDEQYDIHAIDDDGHAYKLDLDFYSFIENFCLGTALENFPQLFRTMTYEMEYPVNRFTAIPGIQEPSI